MKIFLFELVVIIIIIIYCLLTIGSCMSEYTLVNANTDSCLMRKCLYMPLLSTVIGIFLCFDALHRCDRG